MDHLQDDIEKESHTPPIYLLPIEYRHVSGEEQFSDDSLDGARGIIAGIECLKPCDIDNKDSQNESYSSDKLSIDSLEHGDLDKTLEDRELYSYVSEPVVPSFSLENKTPK